MRTPPQRAEVLEAVRAGRVTYARLAAPYSAPAAYRHVWQIGGVSATPAQRRALDALLAEHVVDHAPWGIGPRTVPVMLRPAARPA